MTQVADKPVKVKKPKVDTYHVDGLEVTMIQVTPDIEHGLWEDKVSYATRSKYEVRVNGGLVGFVFYPKGVGNPWVLTSLIPNACDQYSFHSDYVLAWEPPVENPDHPGMYKLYGGVMGLLQPLRPWRRDLEPDKDHGQWANTDVTDWWGWESREQIASFIPRFWLAGRMPGPEGVIKKIAEAKAERIRRAEAARAEAIAEKARDVQRAENRRLAVEEANRLRRETREGLETIRERFGADMTNFESAALAEALKQFGG